MKFSRRIDRFIKVLHHAIRINNINKVSEILIKNSNLLNQPDNYKQKLKFEINCLFLQNKNCDKKIDHLLEFFLNCIEKEASVYLQSYLELAITAGDAETVDLLLKNGAEIDYFQLDKLWCINVSRNNIKKCCDMFKLLIDYGLETIVKKRHGENLLHWFLFSLEKYDHDAMKILEILMSSGVPLDEVNGNGITPLIDSIERQNIPLVLMFLKAGADTNKKDEWNELPLHSAVRYCNKDLVELLVSKGADINRTNNHGMTALHIACSRHHEEIIRFLIQKGANISAEDDFGRTPYSLLVPFVENYENCSNAMIREFSSLIFENFTVPKKDLDLVNGNFETKEYFIQCLAEIKKMASTKFYGIHSYYSVLKWSKNITKFARFTKNKRFVLQFERNLTFYHYKKDLLRIFEEAKKVKEILLIVDLRLHLLFGKFLPAIVIRKLADCLKLENLPLQLIKKHLGLHLFDDCKFVFKNLMLCKKF